MEWVSFLLHKHQPLLLDLVRGGGGGGVGGKVGGEEPFLSGFLDLSLTSSGELRVFWCMCLVYMIIYMYIYMII